MEKCLAMTHESSLVRFIDSGGSGGLIALLAWEKSSGSGSARLDLSQKGDLPSSGEWAVFIGPRSPARAKNQ
jgi:hypothetical protein